MPFGLISTILDQFSSYFWLSEGPTCNVTDTNSVEIVTRGLSYVNTTIYVVVRMESGLVLTEYVLVRMRTTRVSDTHINWSACGPVGFKGLSNQHLIQYFPPKQNKLLATWVFPKTAIFERECRGLSSKN